MLGRLTECKTVWVGGNELQVSQASLKKIGDKGQRLLVDVLCFEWQ